MPRKRVTVSVRRLKSRAAGDDVTAVALEGAAHFETIVPGTDVWPEVRSTILGMFGKVEH